MKSKTAGLLVLLGLMTPLAGCGEGGEQIEETPPAAEQTQPETTPATTPTPTPEGGEGDEGGEGGEGGEG